MDRGDCATDDDVEIIEHRRACSVCSRWWSETLEMATCDAGTERDADLNERSGRQILPMNPVKLESGWSLAARVEVHFVKAAVFRDLETGEGWAKKNLEVVPVAGFGESGGHAVNGLAEE